ncbi:MAG: GNAT family N-acetyltransferase [Acidimicrobiales bacterium]
MDEAELARRRSQMGRSCSSFLACGPGSVGDQGPGYWVALSGAPSPDLNVALFDTTDPATIERAMRRVEEAGLPTFVMQAGAGLGVDLGPRWHHVADMAFMAFALDDRPLRADSRVRQARHAERGVFNDLLADAFGLENDVAAVVGRVLEADDGTGQAWLLVEGGVPVSTVLTSIIDDAVCVWCMATPARYARRGFGRALLADVLSRAKASGAAIGLLGATPAGKTLYDATGWTTLEQWRISTNADPAQVAG